MKTKFLFLFLSALFLFTSCDNTPDVLPEPEPELKTTNQLLSFSFEKSKNEAYIDEDVVATIADGRIDLSLSEKVNVTDLIATFTHNGESISIGSTPQVSGVTANDFSKQVVYTVRAEDKSIKKYNVNIGKLAEEVAQIPHLYIDTENQQPIDEKKVYRKGTIRIVGGDEYDDFEGDMKIRGRGNSTWGMPKKPYRFKLDEAASLLGLSAEKDWVLLQNYIDPSSMCNSVALKIGQ